jgi:putative tricarboxylic transport membrane protein
VFALLLAMILANVLFIGIAYVCIPLFARIVTLKRAYLVPIIVLVAFAGSYVYRSDSFDLQILVIFGVVGYCARKLEFDVVPLVMGFILGPELEYTIAQTTIMARGEFLTFLFTERYIAAGLYTTIVVALAYFGYRAFTRKPKKSEGWMPVGDDLG